MRDIPNRRGRFLIPFILLAGINGLPGCVLSNHSLVSLPPECVEACQSLPGCCRGQVYVFLVNGFDPFDLASVADVRATLIRAGFNKVYDGQFYHAPWFANEMRRLRDEEPDARFVVIGFGAGVEAAVGLAESVAQDGIEIDRLAYVDAPFWSSAPGRRPANVGDVLAVHGKPFLQGTGAVAERDVEIPVDFWAGVSAHPLTLEWLVSELTGVAGAVPALAANPPATVANDLPTPRPLVARPEGPRDNWDFLKPVVRLREAVPLPPEPSTAPTPPSERTALR